MKKFFSMMAACLLLAGVTACNDDDETSYEYTPLTKAERMAQLRNMQGNYEGTVFYNINEYTNKADSANITATLTASDSLMQINNLPIKIIEKQLQEKYRGKLDTTAVMPTLNAHLSVYLPWGYLPSDAEKVHWFTFIPGDKNNSTSFPVSYGGEQRMMTISYSLQSNNYASNGAYTNNRMAVQFIIKSVAIDGEFGATYISEIMNARLIKK